MKKFLFLLFLLPAFMNAAIPSFSLYKVSILEGNPNLDAISKALAAGDVEVLAKYFADQVEISILDKEQVYPKAKAVETVRGFFNNNKPKGFNQVHQGTSRENSDQYCIGNMSASNGNFRVYIYLKVNGNSASIQELRFDKA